jgi:hypothetical protein
MDPSSLIVSSQRTKPYVYDAAEGVIYVQTSPPAKGSTTRIYIYDEDISFTSRMTREPQEEGGYEYISDHHGGTSGKEEAHIEPAILVQPLGDTAEGYEEGGESSDVLAPPPCVVNGCSRGERRHRHSHSGGPAVTCGDVGGAAVGAVGTFVGGAIGDVPGAYIGGAIGGYAGSHAGEAVCHG